MNLRIRGNPGLTNIWATTNRRQKFWQYDLINLPSKDWSKDEWVAQGCKAACKATRGSILAVQGSMFAGGLARVRQGCKAVCKATRGSIWAVQDSMSAGGLERLAQGCKAACKATKVRYGPSKHFGDQAWPFSLHRSNKQQSPPLRPSEQVSNWLLSKKVLSRPQIRPVVGWQCPCLAL